MVSLIVHKFYWERDFEKRNFSYNSVRSISSFSTVYPFGLFGILAWLVMLGKNKYSSKRWACLNIAIASPSKSPDRRRKVRGESRKRNQSQIVWMDMPDPCRSYRSALSQVVSRPFKAAGATKAPGSACVFEPWPSLLSPERTATSVAPLRSKEWPPWSNERYLVNNINSPAAADSPPGGMADTDIWDTGWW